LLLFVFQVRCTTACTEDCSSNSVTAETGSSSNDNLTVNSVSGNKASGGGRWTRALSDGAISDQNKETWPNPVQDLKAEYVGETSVNLTWTVTDTNSSSYTYRIEVVNGSSHRNLTFSDPEAEITELVPGTLYTFTVFAVASDGQTEGEGVSIDLYTRPNPVQDLKAEYVGETSVNLTWTVTDTNSSSYMYRIEVVNGSSHRNLTFSVPGAEITELVPGTLYTFMVFAGVNDSQTEGGGVSIDLYTRPNPVQDLKADFVGETSVNLTWIVTDTNSSSYTYRIEVVNGSSHRNLTFSAPGAEITELVPRTLYTFTVFAGVNNSQTEGGGVSVDLYTGPNPVQDLKAEYVGETSVNLTWTVTDTNSSSYMYRIEVVNGSSHRNLTFSAPGAEITELVPGTLYTFTVFARVNDSQTEWEGVPIELYTRPSPVLDLKAKYVGETSVNLTWTVTDTNSSSYTYRIEVVNGSSPVNLTFSAPEAEITELLPGTLYTFTVFAGVNNSQTEGGGVSVDLYTGPNPVQDLKAEYVGETSVNLTWTVTDTNSSSYMYRIEVVNGSSHRNLTFSAPGAEITELVPGTLYTFTVFARVNDSQTEWEGVPIELYTKPSPVQDLKAEYVGETSVNLTWTVTDTNSSSYMYRIEVVNGSSPVNLTFSAPEAVITELLPGMLYTFRVFAGVNDSQTEGEGVSIDLYTRPSPVQDLKAEYVGETSVNLTWTVTDTNSSSYTYRIEVVSSFSQRNLTFSVPKAVITELVPGTLYTFMVFAGVNDSQTEGEGVSIGQYTIPASVNSFQCEPVAKQPSLMLKWKCPFGNNSGFMIKISKDSWVKEENASLCVSEGSENNFSITSLAYFSTYDVTIVTLSDGPGVSPEVHAECNTSITDPPAPSEHPIVKAVSHSSLSVEFSDFESVNGPLKAYAVMITTGQDCESLESKLSNTYQDFKKKATVTYVAHVINTEQTKSPAFHSQNGTNVVDVGKGSRTYGYENGPLIPVRSYRASVAGFTNISFTTAGIIVGEDSYVSFSPCSEAVLLPQDPGLIAGAVIGCLLGVFAVVAIGGFIFWRRRRKDKRNTEVSFSPIKIKKSKLVKVENFESYFKKQQADSNCGFAEEYEELKSAGVHQPKFAAELAENRGKNRYNNVLPYDISRVKLSDQSSASGDYINANYIPGYNSKKAFIAAQGPLPNTIEDFWRMVWEKNIYSVVMLTKCVEQARTKCEQYWPDKQSKSYGDIIVTMVSEVVLPEWTIRDFTVEKANTPESHTVRQFHFTSWPDHGVPETTDLLINFRHLVHEYSSQNPIDSPTLVHCSAGVGRTGTFIAIDRLIQQMEMESTVDVYGVVYDLRMHRPLMVQTEDQYVFLNQCVMDIIRSQKDKKTDLIYQNMTAMAIYENFTPGPGFGKANGYHA
ncbi:receptor-type tyrosine-protein phosphatase eta, partial [Indicator indicator]|uniref:receptor-type tyrosine-protein phosphatase eta n=1 Tax=Indicator indicator TaxID=1002788 RepID=UPI0023DF90CA